MQERKNAALKLERPRGEIALESVTFKYDEKVAPVIDNLRLTIKPGGLITVMGPNGSGKTTLVKLIQGLYAPTNGRVLLDGADISQFTRSELAGWMGYVPQELFLFAGSIRDNIAKGRPDASDDEVLQASRLAGLHAYVIDYPDGYATEIGEAGRVMPGGLRQRLTIARALIGNPPILLLDEPSSNLDREGEADLCRTLKEFAKDHTVIAVTHSSAILAASYQVLVMQKGRIVRAGRPEDVLPQISAAQAGQMAAQHRAAARAGRIAATPSPGPERCPRAATCVRRTEHRARGSGQPAPAVPPQDSTTADPSGSPASTADADGAAGAPTSERGSLLERAGGGEGSETDAELKPA